MKFSLLPVVAFAVGLSAVGYAEAAQLNGLPRTTQTTGSNVTGTGQSTSGQGSNTQGQGDANGLGGGGSSGAGGGGGNGAGGMMMGGGGMTM